MTIAPRGQNLAVGRELDLHPVDSRPHGVIVAPETRTGYWRRRCEVAHTGLRHTWKIVPTFRV
jgi:hypothetical protein